MNMSMREMASVSRIMAEENVLNRSNGGDYLVQFHYGRFHPIVYYRPLYRWMFGRYIRWIPCVSINILYDGHGEGKWYGAGYVGGWTAYLSIMCHGRHARGESYRHLHVLQIGVTRNGNAVPIPAYP